MIECGKGVTVPTVSQVMQVLTTNLDIRPIYFDYDKVMTNIYALNKRIEEVSEKFKDFAHKSGCNADALTYYLYDKNIAHLFKPTASGKISLNKESIQSALSLMTDAQDIDVLSTYASYNEAVKARQTLVPLLQNPISNQISFDGHRMLEVRPVWAEQNTGRVAMTKPAVQNINRELQTLMTCPRGFMLIHTDSGQVEPRIAYSAFVKDEQIKTLINLYDDAYFGLLHYCTMPLEDIRTRRMQFEKMEITDSLSENRSKIKRDGNAVLYGSQKKDDDIKAAMIERIGNHPARLELVNKIKRKLSLNDFIFETYFGTPIDISNSKKLQTSLEDKTTELIKLAINNPIQGTAADLMRISVMQAQKLIMSTKSASIVCYVHDSGVFCVEEDDYDKIGKQLEDIVAYQVDDWIPIHADSEIYQHEENGPYVKYKY